MKNFTVKEITGANSDTIETDFRDEALGAVKALNDSDTSQIWVIQQNV